MKRQESLMSRYPVVWWIVVLLFVFTLGPAILRGLASALESPFRDCPSGYSSDGDRYEPECVPD